MLTYLEDFKKNPISANPYMVITCFDELVRTKGVALIRGDVISQLSKDEAQTMLNTILNTYLVEQHFENARKFNHEPSHFKYDEYIQTAMNDFHYNLSEVQKTKTAQIDIGTPAKNPWGTIK